MYLKFSIYLDIPIDIPYVIAYLAKALQVSKGNVDIDANIGQGLLIIIASYANL